MLRILGVLTIILFSIPIWIGKSVRMRFGTPGLLNVPKSRVGSPGSFMVSNTYDTYRLSMGRVDVKAVNMRRIRYCAKYVG